MLLAMTVYIWYNNYIYRWNGTILPLPVEKMLESKHGIYDNLQCDLKLNEHYDMQEIFKKMKLF